jgi:hypothetical protein
VKIVKRELTKNAKNKRHRVRSQALATYTFFFDEYLSLLQVTLIALMLLV